MKILVACEYSGVVRDAFATKGHDVLSCDLLDTESPGNHYTGDICDVLYDDWDMIIAHPPCTYLCNSGVSWLHKTPSRWNDLDDGAKFFKLFVDHSCPKICIENPIPHKYAVERIGVKYTQIIQPYQFGHMESKATCLWLKGLPPLVETNNVKIPMMELPISQRQRSHYTSPGPNRGKLRSRTFDGIAVAMAEQWV